MKNLEFKNFLHSIENRTFNTISTAAGIETIQQTTRNELRKEGLAALKADLEMLYGDSFDVVETANGLVIVAENLPGDFTFSWEIKSTIKAIDYDPFVEANKWEDAQEAKAAKLAAKEQAKLALEQKRRRKLVELGRDE